MSFQLASDLHIEYKNDRVDIDPLKYITPTCENLILAGDIGSLYKYEQLRNFLLNCGKMFRRVIYVPGNQEYYLPPKMYDEEEGQYEPLSMDELNRRLETLQFGNITVLNKKVIEIDGITLIGCTLWSYPNCVIPKFIVKIYGVQTKEYKALFLDHLTFLKEKLEENRDKTVMVITHHLPSFSLLPNYRLEYRYVSLYASNLLYLTKWYENIQVWIFGHSHKNCDKFFNKTRYVSNQQGKEKDNVVDFKKNFVITVRKGVEKSFLGFSSKDFCLKNVEENVQTFPEEFFPVKISYRSKLVGAV